MASKKKAFLYKGVRYVLKDTFSVAAMPEPLIGRDPSTYALDRWMPATEEDKSRSTKLLERNYVWISTPPGTVAYGLERWGEVRPDVYREWFCLIVVRPLLMSSEESARICASSGWVPSGPRE